jgi:hypothetical protein
MVDTTMDQVRQGLSSGDGHLGLWPDPVTEQGGQEWPSFWWEARLHTAAATGDHRRFRWPRPARRPHGAFVLSRLRPVIMGDVEPIDHRAVRARHRSDSFPDAESTA